jgi:hypothetical protein
MSNELTSKFIKAHFVTSNITPTPAIRWLHKLMYEFWGFCVNGSDDLLVPGGFAPSASILFPPTWESGSAVLLASGSDGSTTLGGDIFTAPSINWTSGSMVGKWLVTWKSGSTSTDDSIYPITQIISSSSIRVDTNIGGTPYSETLQPAFTARPSINFRVVDFAASIGLSGFTANDDGLVFQLNAAPLVNSNQLPTQCRTRIRTSVGANLPHVGLTLSPSGTWTPASSSGNFLDSTFEINGPATWGTGGSGNGYISLMGAQDYLICHFKGLNAWNTNASGFHLEVPKRVLPESIDPNPVIAMNFANQGLTITSNTQNYGGGFVSVNPKTQFSLPLRSMIKPTVSDYFYITMYASTSVPNNYTSGRFNETFYNAYLRKIMIHEIAFSSVSQNFFSLLFLRLRRAKYVHKVLASPNLVRIGDYGEWITMQNGILWPWDGSILPYNLNRAGF